jgi:hypothetical protein
MESRRDRFEAHRGEAGYSWLYRASVLNGGTRVLFTILVISLAAGLFAWYTRSENDPAPDSLFGLIYAIIGSLLLLFAATLYTLRKRSHRRRVVGGLRASLGWHICFAIIGLAFLGMHSFGELNPRTGTYALYGMVALVISGLIGRMLDRLMPRLIAGEVHQVLTEEGDDRIETISQKLQAIVVHNTQDIRGFAVSGQTKSAASNSLVPFAQNRPVAWQDQTLHTPWDLAYISLESTPQELSREAGQFRFVPDEKSELLRPGALMPGSQEHISELEEVRQAMQHELFYRYVIRYWRAFHVLLALVTLGLLVWHVVYALQLMIPPLMH